MCVLLACHFRIQPAGQMRKRMNSKWCGEGEEGVRRVEMNELSNMFIVCVVVVACMWYGDDTGDAQKWAFHGDSFWHRLISEIWLDSFSFVVYVLESRNVSLCFLVVLCVAASTRNEIVTFFPGYLWDTGNIDDREISLNSPTEPVSWWKIPLECGVFSLIRDSECFKLFLFLLLRIPFPSLHHNQSAISINFPANVVNTTRLCVSFSFKKWGWKSSKSEVTRGRESGATLRFHVSSNHPIDTDIIMRLGRFETWNFSHLNSMLLLDTECFCFELSEWKV